MDDVTRTILASMEAEGITVVIEQVGGIYSVTAHDESGRTWVAMDHVLREAVVLAAAEIETEGEEEDERR